MMLKPNHATQNNKKKAVRKMKVLILGGTRDATIIAQELCLYRDQLNRSGALQKVAHMGAANTASMERKNTNLGLCWDVMFETVANQHFAGTELDITYSVAGLVRVPKLPCKVISGGFSQYAPVQRMGKIKEFVASEFARSVLGLESYLLEHNIDLLIDATHPFATKISKHAVEAAKSLSVPCWSYVRQPWTPKLDDDWFFVDNWDEVLTVTSHYKRPFFTVGKSCLDHVEEKPDNQQWLIRTAAPSIHGTAADEDDEDALNQDSDWHRTKDRLRHEIQAQKLSECLLVHGIGPFSVADEVRTLKKHHIDILVCKNSGGERDAKLVAAKQLGIPVIMFSRPFKKQGDKVFFSPEEMADSLVRLHKNSARLVNR
ncbi:precorrin-6x reductase [Oleiphilus messinensis]|uniref:Precorrin-6x reductase n=1 Tax=Oleiphilus messinensis TaxID=141451 RepID=A0A1Y0IBP9_9GAMM|nr:precorrin-6A/cobalt-precorrin-6A reductase [Oleiphilus messinensis]ARU56803.1 precorrin-6x reductase [Oleiphilus messinensis]